jgi:hypothetical protein
VVPAFLLDIFRAVLAGALSVALATPQDSPVNPPAFTPDAPSAPGPDTAGRQAGAAPSGSGPRVGADISWPNCPKGLGIPSRRSLGKPLPRRSARFVVIGLTNGPAFHPNPCLVSQVAFAKERRLYAAAYAVATYPTTSQLARYGAAGPHSHSRRHGRLWNTGYAQARINVAEMRKVGLDSPVVWVDVEPVTDPAPWSGRPRQNKAVLDGVLEGYRSAGLRVGFYSVPRLWRSIVGPARYRLPEWRTAGDTSRRAALRECTTDSIQGGPAVIAQWWDADRDYDVLCPGRPAGQVLARYFTTF